MFCQTCGGATELREIESQQRPICIVCGTVTYLDPKLAVAVMISRDGKLLFGKRSSSSREAGKWSFPAGFVERGERVEDAASREVREETGLEIHALTLFDLISSVGETVVLAVYLASATGEPRAADDLVETGWFSPDQLPELAFPHDREIVQKWIANQNPD